MSNQPENKNVPEESKAGLSDQKKTALLRYMAVLFGVAFLLVLLSLLIQMRDSNETISTLSQSKAGALERAELLQNENQKLTEQNQTLSEQTAALEAQVADLEVAATADEETIETLEETCDGLTEQLSESQTQLGDTQKAYDLLIAANKAHAAEDTAALRQNLSALESLKDLLSPESRAAYDILVGSLTAETP